MARHVALLRAVNLGRRNKVPMQELRRVFEALGCGGVRSYVQSGNVVFEADARLARRIPATIADAIERRWGVRTAVITRTATEVSAVVDRVPVPVPDDHRFLQVAFLATAPRAGAALDPARSPGDSFEVVGREVYLLYPNGTARSKLDNAYIERALGTTSTMRNWRTVRALVEMLDA